MSELLFESPVMLGVTGAVLTLVAVITWIKGGFKAALYIAAALMLLTILLVWMNLQVRTDREQVQGVMSDVAAAVKRNDLDGVLKYLHTSQSAALTRARAQLPTYKFTEARITGIKKIEINADTTPPSAIAEFNISVSVTGNAQSLERVPAFVRCYFLKDGQRWLVNDYEVHEATYGFKTESER